jgi:hypothetical protein
MDIPPKYPGIRKSMSGNQSINHKKNIMKNLVKLFAFGILATLSFNNVSAQNAHLAEWSIDGNTLTAKFAGLGNQTWCITVGVTLEESIVCQKVVELGNGGENIITQTKTRTGTAQFLNYRTQRNGNDVSTQTITYEGDRVQCPNDNSGFEEAEGSYSSTANVISFTAVKDCL